MGFWSKLFSKKEETTEDAETVKKRIATANGEPYINVIQLEVDKGTPGIGSFELDWNVYFISYLREHGYEGKTDEQIVDRWFTDLCRNVVLETYEQYEANNPSYVTKRNLGGGRTEIG